MTSPLLFTVLFKVPLLDVVVEPSAFWVVIEPSELTVILSTHSLPRPATKRVPAGQEETISQT